MKILYSVNNPVKRVKNQVTDVEKTFMNYILTKTCI